MVQRQLQEFKVLDTALMQSYGYPVRIKHAHFLKIYGALLPSDLTEQLTAKRKCERILQEAVLKDYRVGRTTVCGMVTVFAGGVSSSVVTNSGYHM